MANDNNNNFVYYRYDPSKGAAIFFAILFAIMSIIHFYQLIRTRTWVFIPFVIGGIFEIIGYIGRVISSNQTPNWTLGPFLIQDLLLLVAPALFASSIYMVLGRIILVTDAERFSPIRKKWLTKIFVFCDIVSFFVIAIGGGIESSGNGKHDNLGKIIIEIGLVFQVLTFSLFMLIGWTFHRRLNKNPTSKVLSGRIPWKKHMRPLYYSCALLLVRNIFRVAEFAQGNAGYLISHEVFLYVFDGCLVLSVMVIFGWTHPSEIYAILKGGSKKKAVRKFVKVYNVELFDLETSGSNDANPHSQLMG